MSDDRTSENQLTRRAMLGTSVAGLGTVALAGAAAAQDATPTGPAAAPRDPRTKHPRPSFAPQRQEWPGLTGRMDPRPDHGEDSYKGSGRLAGRRALVTGGDSGLGRAAVIAFAREGADVAINYLPQEEEDAQEVVALIRAEGRVAVAIPGDLRDEAFCRRLVRQAAERLGGLDVLVANASRQQANEDPLRMSTEAFDATMKTNLYAMFWLTQAAVPLMPAGGSIVVTSSSVAFKAVPFLVDYSMTKAAQVNFVRSMGQVLATRGIPINAVVPGPFWTPIQISGGLPERIYTTLGSDLPVGRPGQPAEIAGLFVGLAEEGNSFATGQVHSATGGTGEA